MATVSLVWADGDRLRMAAIDGDAVITIGRDAECNVVLSDPTVSRRQAGISPQRGGHRLENLSETNVTRVNGKGVSESADITDGDRITAGNASVAYHDLSAADRISGPVCSHCGRENDGSAAHCWFCGTSLVNALSVARKRIRLAFRAVALDGTSYDVYPGQALQFDQPASPAVLRSEDLAASAPAVEAGEHGPRLRLPEVDAGSVAINGRPAAAGSAINDGDELTVEGGRFLVLVRSTA